MYKKEAPSTSWNKFQSYFSLFTPSYYNYSYYAVIPQTTFWG